MPRPMSDPYLKAVEDDAKDIGQRLAEGLRAMVSLGFDSAGLERALADALLFVRKELHR